MSTSTFEAVFIRHHIKHSLRLNKNCSLTVYLCSSSFRIKMKLLTDTESCRVPFDFHAKTVTLKVTRFTTFHDVVHMLTRKAGITKSSARLYTAYECMWELERPIGGEVRVLNIWRAVGCKTNNFRLVVKLPDSNTLLENFNRSHYAKADTDVNNVLSESYNKENAHQLTGGTADTYIPTLDSSLSELFEIGQINKSFTRRTSLANIAFNVGSTTISSVNTPSETSPRTTQPINEHWGKKTLLAKYLNDVKLFGKRKSKKQTLGKRGRADGAEVPEAQKGRHVEGIEDPDSTGYSMTKCIHHWGTHCNSDIDSDSDTSDDYLDSAFEYNKESDVSKTSSLARNVRALDTAFLPSSRYAEFEEGFDVTSMNSSDLNTAFLADVELQCVTDEEYSELVYSDGIFENNCLRTIVGADMCSFTR